MLLQLFLCNAPHDFQLLKNVMILFFSRAQGSCYIHKTNGEQSSELGKVLLSIQQFYEFNDLCVYWRIYRYQKLLPSNIISAKICISVAVYFSTSGWGGS